MIPLHLHELDYVVVPLVGGILHVVESDGIVSEMELISGASYARESGVEHVVTNRGGTSIEFVKIERLCRLSLRVTLNESRGNKTPARPL